MQPGHNWGINRATGKPVIYDFGANFTFGPNGLYREEKAAA